MRVHIYNVTKDSIDVRCGAERSEIISGEVGTLTADTPEYRSLLIMPRAGAAGLIVGLYPGRDEISIEVQDEK